MKIFVFGDNVVHGFGDTKGGWVQRLSSILQTASLENMLNGDGKSYIEVYNLGVSGDSTAGVLKRLKNEVEARRTYDEDEIIILAVGLNDSILKSDNLVLMDVYEFQEKYEKLIQEAQSLVGRVYCVGLTAVDEELTSPWPQSTTGKQWRNNRIILFEDAIKQSSIRLSVPFIPIYSEFIAKMNNGEELLSDGLLPNDAGHEFIASVVATCVVNKPSIA